MGDTRRGKFQLSSKVKNGCRQITSHSQTRGRFPLCLDGRAHPLDKFTSAPGVRIKPTSSPLVMLLDKSDKFPVW